MWRCGAPSECPPPDAERLRGSGGRRASSLATSPYRRPSRPQRGGAGVGVGGADLAGSSGARLERGGCSWRGRAALAGARARASCYLCGSSCGGRRRRRRRGGRYPMVAADPCWSPRRCVCSALAGPVCPGWARRVKVRLAGAVSSSSAALPLLEAPLDVRACTPVGWWEPGDVALPADAGWQSRHPASRTSASALRGGGSGLAGGAPFLVSETVVVVARGVLPWSASSARRCGSAGGLAGAPPSPRRYSSAPRLGGEQSGSGPATPRAAVFAAGVRAWWPLSDWAQGSACCGQCFGDTRRIVGWWRGHGRPQGATPALVHELLRRAESSGGTLVCQR